MRGEGAALRWLGYEGAELGASSELRDMSWRGGAVWENCVGELSVRELRAEGLSTGASPQH